MWEVGIPILGGGQECSYLQSCLSSPISQVFHGVRWDRQQVLDEVSMFLLLPTCSLATPHLQPPSCLSTESRIHPCFLSACDIPVPWCLSPAHLQKLCFLIWTITTFTWQSPCLFHPPSSKVTPAIIFKGGSNHGQHVPLASNFPVHMKCLN